MITGIQGSLLHKMVSSAKNKGTLHWLKNNLIIVIFITGELFFAKVRSREIMWYLYILNRVVLTNLRQNDH